MKLLPPHFVPFKYVAPVFMFHPMDSGFKRKTTVIVNLVLNSILPTKLLKRLDGRKRLEARRKREKELDEQLRINSTPVI